MLFDKICRKNGVTHRLTAPASPTTTGKIERFHLTLRRELLDEHDPFESLAAAQAAVDAFVQEYNHQRPHQGLDEHAPVTPAQRFTPSPPSEPDLIEMWLPAVLNAPAMPASGAGIATQPQETPATQETPPQPALPDGRGRAWAGAPVEFTRVVPASGNLMVARKQFWLGPVRAGQVVRFWADCDLIHLMIGGARVKTIRSHLTVNDLAQLAAAGAVAAGPSPLPPVEPGGHAVETERCVNRTGSVVLAGRCVLAAEILAGRHVGIRIEPAVLMFFDLDTRELLRTRANPFTAEQLTGIRGLRPAGPPPRPRLEPVRVQRRASNVGVVMVCGQKIALGRDHNHRTVTIWVSETTVAIELDDGETRVVRRTTTQPVRNIKADRPRTVPTVS